MKDIKEIAAVTAIKPAEAPRPTQQKDRVGDVATAKQVENVDPANLPAGRDRITIDKSAEATQAAAAARQAAMQVRSARIADIEAAIRRGDYKPDPRRIAQEIINDAELMARIHVLFNKPKPTE